MIIQKITSHPVFTISSWLFGLIGLVFALYSYEKTRQSGDLSYAIASRLIYSSIERGVSHSIPNILSPEHENKGDIYVSQITIWNSGTSTIEPKDKRSPTRIGGDNNFYVFNYDIINKKSGLGDNFDVSSPSRSNIEVNWKFFDPEDAVKIQVVHAGKPDSIALVGLFGPNIVVAKKEVTLVLALFVFAISLACTIYLNAVVISRLWFRFFGDPNASFIRFAAYIVQFLALMAAIFMFTSYVLTAYNGMNSPIGANFDGVGGVDYKKLNQ